MKSELYTLLRDPDAGVGVYGEFEGPVPPDCVRPYLPRGSVVAIRPHPGSGWHEVANDIGRVAARVINSSLALWPDRLDSRVAVSFATRARPLGAHAVVWTADPPTETIRTELVDVEDWPRQLLVWLRRRGLHFTTEAAWALDLLAARSPRHRFLGQLAHAEDMSAHRLKRCLESIGAGSAHQWWVAIRITGIALRIQQHHALKLEDIAYRLGFSSAAALGDRCWDLIGARPSSIRSLVGWQWILCDAGRRMGLRLVRAQ